MTEKPNGESSSRALFQNKGRILLVDDEPLVLEMFESVLVREGYDVSVAANSAEAISQLERTTFNVLVCDVKLEEYDGFEIMQFARERHPDIAVVLITGAPSDDDKQRANSKFATYLSKPIGFDMLITSIGETLDSARGEQRRRAPY